MRIHGFHGSLRRKGFDVETVVAKIVQYTVKGLRGKGSAPLKAFLLCIMKQTKLHFRPWFFNFCQMMFKEIA
jgi:hypothetical protein